MKMTIYGEFLLHLLVQGIKDMTFELLGHSLPVSGAAQLYIDYSEVGVISKFCRVRECTATNLKKDD